MADQELPTGPEPVTNIVLVGSTGNGKSSTGNTILSKNLFKSKKQAKGVTMKCEMYRAAIQDGPIINVIDTPGLVDTAVSEDLSTEISNCLTMAEEGIHAVLFVLTLKNLVSQKEESTLHSLQCIFESKILDYFIVVFTGGDELEEDEQSLDDYFREGCPEFLTRVLRLCGGRKVLFDNRTTDINKKAEQIKQLLAHVADVGKQTGGKPYTYQMHRNIKEEYDHEKLREQERAIESKNLAEAEIEMLKEKLRMEQEKNKMMTTLAIENDEKVSDQERVILAEEELAVMQDRLRIEQERNKQMTAHAEEYEKLRAHERAIESKKLAKAELALKQEKLLIQQERSQMEEENKEMIALAEEYYDEKLREQERMIESMKHAEAELAVMHVKLLGMEQEKNKQTIALAEENNKKLRDQEMMIEYKKFVEAELLVLQEKLREKEMVIESKKLVEAELAVLQEKLREQEIIAYHLSNSNDYI